MVVVVGVAVAVVVKVVVVVVVWVVLVVVVVVVVVEVDCVGGCASEAFRRSPTRQGGPSPPWPVGERWKPSDGHPPARGDTSLRGRCPSCPVGRTQLPLSHKQTSSDPTRRFRQVYD